MDEDYCLILKLNYRGEPINFAKIRMKFLDHGKIISIRFLDPICFTIPTYKIFIIFLDGRFYKCKLNNLYKGDIDIYNFDVLTRGVL